MKTRKKITIGVIVAFLAVVMVVVYDGTCSAYIFDNK